MAKPKKSKTETKPNSVGSLIGMSEVDAIVAIRQMGMSPRIMEKDGESFMGTCDFRTDRVNLAISEGKVISADIG